MTAAVRHQEWLIYRFWDAQGRLLYIGQTGRMAVARWLEHIRHQPWAGQIARMEVDPQVFGSLADVLRAEKAAIRREQPVYNDVHNRANPHRVAVTRPTGWSTARPRAFDRRRAWPRWRIRLIVAAVAWLTVAIAMTWAVLPQVPVRTALWLGPTVATAFVVTAAWQSRRPRRRRW